jgi:hypothetical protein
MKKVSKPLEMQKFKINKQLNKTKIYEPDLREEKKFSQIKRRLMHEINKDLYS